MGILEIGLLLILPYIVTGYTIGKIANGEYFDNTPTEELSLFKRIKRLLLFPVSYHQWTDREFTNSVGPRLRNLSNSHQLSCQREARENYCRTTTFLWPFKLIPVLIGTAEILYFCIVNTAYGISQIPSQGNKYLGTGIKSLGRAKRKLLPASSDLSSHVDNIESFLNSIRVQKDTLSAQKSDISNAINELEANIRIWHNLLFGQEKPEHAHIKEILLALNAELVQYRKKADDLNNTLDTISDRERQLKECVTTLAQCKRTMALGISIASASGEGLIQNDAIALLARTTISSAQSYITECQGLLEKV